MRIGGVALAIVACFAFGCGKPAPSHVEIQIDRNGQCVVDDTPCGADSLMRELNVKRQRSGGQCSLRITCDPNIASSVFFRVVNEAARSGIWEISLQVGERSESVDCSRPVVGQFAEVAETEEEDVIDIMVSANTFSVDGADCALSDLYDQLKNKGDTAIVKARPDSSVGQIHAALHACESLSLKAWLFKYE